MYRTPPPLDAPGFRIVRPLFAHLLNLVFDTGLVPAAELFMEHLWQTHLVRCSITKSHLPTDTQLQCDGKRLCSQI